MAAPDKAEEVEILPPDTTLLTKVGLHNITSLFTDKAEATAQAMLEASKGDFRQEMLAEFQLLEKEFWSIADASADCKASLVCMTELAFSIKAKSGLADYKLVSALAKSLYLYCEACSVPFTGKSRDVIDWHIQSIGKILKLDIKGDGGAIGEALNAELEKLNGAK
jgi:hypothetical protein